MALRRWLITSVLLASSGCAVLGGVVDNARRDHTDHELGPCAFTKAGAVGDVILTGVWIGAAIHAAGEDPPDLEYTAVFAADAAITAISALVAFGGYTCQDGYLFGQGRPADDAPAPTRALPVATDDPLTLEKRDCMKGVAASCATVFERSDSPVVRIDAGTRACKGDPASGICDDVAAIVQPTDPARAVELLELGCTATDAASCSALASLRPH